MVRLVQVAYAIGEKKTRKRELAALFGAARKLHCDDLWLITNDTTETVQDGEQTAHIVAARDWLVQAHSSSDRWN